MNDTWHKLAAIMTHNEYGSLTKFMPWKHVEAIELYEIFLSLSIPTQSCPLTHIGVSNGCQHNAYF